MEHIGILSHKIMECLQEFALILCFNVVYDKEFGIDENDIFF